MADPISGKQNNYTLFADNANRLAAEAQTRYASIQEDITENQMEEQEISQEKRTAELQHFMDEQQVAQYQELLDAAIADSPLNRCCYDIIEFTNTKSMCMMGMGMGYFDKENGKKITLTGQELLDLHSLLSQTKEDGTSLTPEELVQKLGEMGYNTGGPDETDPEAALENADAQQEAVDNEIELAEEAEEIDSENEDDDEPAVKPGDIDVPEKPDAPKSSEKTGVSVNNEGGITLRRSDGSEVKLVDANGDGQLNTEDYDFTDALNKFHADMDAHMALLDDIEANLDNAIEKAEESQEIVDEKEDELDENKAEFYYLDADLMLARSEAERNKAYAEDMETLAAADNKHQLEFLESINKQLIVSGNNSILDINTNDSLTPQEKQAAIGKVINEINDKIKGLTDFQTQNASKNPGLSNVNISNFAYTDNVSASAGASASQTDEELLKRVNNTDTD